MSKRCSTRTARLNRPRTFRPTIDGLGATGPRSVRFSLFPSPSWLMFFLSDGTDASASQLLGELDSAFLFCYAAAMFASGFVAERVNLRYFLALGMLLSGVFSYLFGIAKTYEIHNIGYYVFVQASAGVFQTTGWPGVVTVVGNWFGKGKRGLIFGIWNSHTSIGNILGSLIAGYYVETDWSLSFVVPGLIIGTGGFAIFLFLVVNPSDVGCVETQTINKRQYRRLENTVVNNGGDSDYNSETDDTEILIGEQVEVSPEQKHIFYILLTPLGNPTSSHRKKPPAATDDRIPTRNCNRVLRRMQNPRCCRIFRFAVLFETSQLHFSLLASRLSENLR